VKVRGHQAATQVQIRYLLRQPQREGLALIIMIWRGKGGYTGNREHYRDAT
jgi:hypothetical protein